MLQAVLLPAIASSTRTQSEAVAEGGEPADEPVEPLRPRQLPHVALDILDRNARLGP
jgi:hypothetical protein